MCGKWVVGRESDLGCLTTELDGSFGDGLDRCYDEREVWEWNYGGVVPVEMDGDIGEKEGIIVELEME